MILERNNLETLNLEHNEDIEVLDVSNNNLKHLHLGVKKHLKRLICYDNEITSIDISGCPKLNKENISCYENFIIKE